MVIKKKIRMGTLKVTLALEQSLLDRMEAVRKLAEANDMEFDLNGDLCRFISAQVSRAETVLQESSK